MQITTNIKQTVNVKTYFKANVKYKIFCAKRPLLQIRSQLIRNSHPGTKYGGIWMYPEISGPNMVISIFAMTV